MTSGTRVPGLAVFLERDVVDGGPVQVELGQLAAGQFDSSSATEPMQT